LLHWFPLKELLILFILLIQSKKIKLNMTRKIRVDTDVPIGMGDGTILRADVYRPDDGEKHSAIFVQTPYGKAFGPRQSSLDIVEMTHAGYALIFQDIRGRFSSEGNYGPREDGKHGKAPGKSRDGYDSVEWIASQSWCDGNVAMGGISALAFAQWATALDHPPSLKAIAPWMGPMSSATELHITGGAAAMAGPVGGAPSAAVNILHRLERIGEDVSEIRRAVLWAIENPKEVYNFLPLKDLPFLKHDLIRQQWDARLNPPVMPIEALLDRYRQIHVPCFHLTGWFEMGQYHVFDSFLNIRKLGSTQIARGGQHIVVGPWAHGGVNHHHLGAMNFGFSANYQTQAQQMMVRFYDRYVRGKNVHIPVVTYFVMGKNQWKVADDYPIPSTQWQRYFLHSNGQANTANGNGVLDLNEPVNEPPDRFMYDPHDPVPTIGGRTVAIGLVPGPQEQSHIEKRSDVLCYTTEELTEDTEITGPIILHLFASTSARDTDFTAKLIDVFPDGRAYNILDGIKRASGLKSVDTPELVEPEKIYEFIIQLGHTGMMFQKGHRLRIDISSSNFPAYDRNMNTGNPIGEDVKGILARQTIYHQKAYASYIDLPVIPGYEEPRKTRKKKVD